MENEDFFRFKKNKLKELDFAKAQAVVNYCMNNKEGYRIERLKKLPCYLRGCKKNFAALIVISLPFYIELKILLPKADDEYVIEEYVKRVSGICQAIKTLKNHIPDIEKGKAREAASEIKRICAMIFPKSCKFFFEIHSEAIFNRIEKENPSNLLDEKYSEIMISLGDGVSVSPLITQEQWLSAEGLSCGSLVESSAPEDAESFLSVMKFCNDISLLSGRTPCYSLDGDFRTEKWLEAVELDADGMFYCDMKANGYRVPTLLELKWMKEKRITDGFCEFFCDSELPPNDHISYAFCDSAFNVYSEWLLEEGKIGVAFRVICRD